MSFSSRDKGDSLKEKKGHLPTSFSSLKLTNPEAPQWNIDKKEWNILIVFDSIMSINIFFVLKSQHFNKDLRLPR